MNHTSAIVTRVGAKEISVSFRIVIAAVTENILEIKNYSSTFPSYNSSLNPFIVNNPNNYKFIYQLSRRFEKRNNQKG